MGIPPIREVQNPCGFYAKNSYLCSVKKEKNMTVESMIQEGVVRAVKELYGLDAQVKDVQLQSTRKEFEGNLTVVVFPYVKAARKAPAVVGTEIGDWLVKNLDVVDRFNAVNGFLNIVVDPKHWTKVLEGIAATPNYGIKAATDAAPLVMIEYSSPNTNKPLHLGHLRNILLGHSLSEILKACGNRVVKTNIVNDRGIHICKSMLAWQKWGDGITPEKAGKKGDHLIGDFYVLFDKKYKEQTKKLIDEGMPEDEAKEKAPLLQEARDMLRRWEANDPEIRGLWAQMNQWVYDGFDRTYNRMGVGFDKIYYESDTYLEGKKEVERGLSEGLFNREEDGSVWADLTDKGLDKKLLLRRDGTSVYMTQDIGTAKLRYNDYPIDKMVYVVGNEQEYHFKVLSHLLDRLGFAWGKSLVHFSYGMVELPEGKMKSREGTVVDADDLMAEMVDTARQTGEEMGKIQGLSDSEKDEVYETVGLGALKYFLLKVDPKKGMMFNPKESIDFNGNTGPFIQYTHARIRSLLRKAEEQGMDANNYIDAIPNEREVALIQRLAEYPAVVEEAGCTYSPSTIANYAYALTKEYNQFYHDCAVLGESDASIRALRLTLSRVTADVIASALSLLGIRAPQRM